MGETITKFQIAGIILVLATLFFFSIKEKNDSDLERSDKKKHSFKWLTIAVFAAFFTGCALVFSKRNALTFANYFKEYLILLNAVTVLASLPYIFWAAAKKKIKLIPDIHFLCSVALMAIINDVYNIIYMIIVGKFSSAFFFPVASVVATIFVVLCSRLFLKEKLSGKAYVGILLSIIAITLLSL